MQGREFANAAGLLGGSTVLNAPKAPDLKRIVQRIRDANARLENLSEEVGEIRHRLYPEPQEGDAQSNPVPAADGIIAEIDQALDGTERLLNTLIGHISGIQRAA